MAEQHPHFNYHQQLLIELYKYCLGQLPFSSEHASDVDREFIEDLHLLTEAKQADEDYQHRGQAIISRIIGHYPHLTPNINRDLLWFFGGDCLHYMGDDEVERYQQLDELLYESQSRGDEVDYASAKAKIFQLH